MMGNQWKTTGGSLGFLKRSWLKTLRTTARTMKDANPAAATTRRPRSEICALSGMRTAPVRLSVMPILPYVFGVGTVRVVRGEFGGTKVLFSLDRRDRQEAICIVFWGHNLK